MMLAQSGWPTRVFLVFLCALPLTAVEYRTYDGTSNNQANPTWGRKGPPFLRSPAYTPRYHGDGHTLVPDLPNPRLISNILNAGNFKDLNPRKLNDAHTVWGQFIDHDFTLTPDNASDPMPVPIPRCDTYMDPDCLGNLTIGMARSTYQVSKQRTPAGHGVPTPAIQWVVWFSV